MSKKIWSGPFILWMLAGTLVPMVALFYYGMTTREGSFTFENMLAIFNPYHVKALVLAIGLSLLSTLICFLLAFPLAIILRNSKWGRQGFLVFVFILPMWMNFLLRTMAWQVILERGGIIATALSYIGLGNVGIINTPAAIVLGMVYDFLPFMVLQIFNTVSRIDNSVIEAAYDLGATKKKVLTSILLPLSLPGIASGVTMVFVPSVTTFAISNTLGGGKVNLIGNIIDQEFTATANWNLGSGISLVMMVFILVSMALLSKLNKEGEEGLI